MELTPGRTLAGSTLADGGLFDVPNMSSRTVDIKVLFPPYDCTPGPNCRKFKRDCLQCFAETDERGFSIADVLMRQDEGAAAPGTGIPGVPHVAMVGAPAMVAGLHTMRHLEPRCQTPRLHLGAGATCGSRT